MDESAAEPNEIESGTEIMPAEVGDDENLVAVDPRALLAAWANDKDEWVRFVVAEVILAGGLLSEAQVQIAYELFRQEKAFDERTLGIVELLVVDANVEEQAPPLVVSKLSDVRGVNALVPGSIIEPHAGLTIIFGENGTGKTGYARIFKALAKSRTDGDILGDVGAETPETPSATISYALGDEKDEFTWGGEHGVAPFTRISIFDSPSVSYHVDTDLEYVYVPAALSLFNYARTAIREVQNRIEDRIATLKAGSAVLLDRFPRDSSVYTQIETLGAATDLDALKAKASQDPEIEKRIADIRQTIAALESDVLPAQISSCQHEVRVLGQACEVASGLLGIDVARYNALLEKQEKLGADYETFRSGLFAAANLPAEPEETWETFIEAGEEYRRHLVSVDAHDGDRCLYCRQMLDQPARELLSKYAEYLEDKISADLREVGSELQVVANSIRNLERSEVRSFLAEQESNEIKPGFYDALATVAQTREALGDATSNGVGYEDNLADIAQLQAVLAGSHEAASSFLGDLQAQAADQGSTLEQKKTELAEAVAAAELARSWNSIEARVTEAKEADRLAQLQGRFRGLLRGLTDLTKLASDQLVNQNFESLFLEECKALRAPELKVQFVGREGKPQRRKTLTSDLKPSLVLSEGEQKVLGLADFLAEARLAGITAPVIFDDPVSSLDHRRVREVAERLIVLSQSNQVIVFTHDILFATTLYALSEKDNHFAYFEMTDEGGKGKVSRGSHPASESIGTIRKDINAIIQTAKGEEGQGRVALVRQGYSRLRAWCEVFAETELLAGVSRRYEPNIRMTNLANIKTEKLPVTISTVNAVFDDACRYTEAHSHPLATLGVAPSLEGFETDWAKMQEARKSYLND
jgi:hypothetical protein